MAASSSSSVRKRSNREDFSKIFTVENPELWPEAVLEIAKREPRAKGIDYLRERARRHLSALGWDFWYIIKKDRSELRYTDLDGKTYISLRMACKGCVRKGGVGIVEKTDFHESFSEKTEYNLQEEFPGFEDETPVKKKRKITRKKPLNPNPSPNPSEESDITVEEIDYIVQQSPGTSSLERPKRFRKLNRKRSMRSKSNKRARRVTATKPENFTSNSVLSLLVEKDIVLPRMKVCYVRNGLVIAKGRITKDGIKCLCCNKVYGMSSFENHANGGEYSSHRPGGSMFLEDGRSLLDCERQFLVLDRKATDLSVVDSIMDDDICSVCHCGGELILCDKCPAAYHLDCVGLQELPEGEWFCSACRCYLCEYCEQGEIVLHCEQCKRGFHSECSSDGNFCNTKTRFCSERCEHISKGLCGILGKSFGVGRKNLSCKIVKLSKDCSDNDPTTIEDYCKLNVALSVMHECFEPMKETHTKDLVKDVFLNRKSTLKRFDFSGFYTVLLERDDEVISVATVRIFGGKAAEVPLVATRAQYRRQGMCRILMNFLEMKLKELGVENLVLVAIPEVLQAWTRSFGFSIMTDFERKKVLDYTFLDFQGTTMCQKIPNPNWEK